MNKKNAAAEILLKNGKMRTNIFFTIVASRLSFTASGRYVAQIYQGTKPRPWYIGEIRRVVREEEARLKMAGVCVDWRSPRRY